MRSQSRSSESRVTPLRAGRSAAGTPEQPRVALVERRRQRVLDPGEERAARRAAAHQRERVVREADERRREHRGERLVVVAVVQQAQVPQQIDHLLLPEVAAAGGAIRGAARRGAARPRTTRRRCRPRRGARSRPRSPRPRRRARGRAAPPRAPRRGASGRRCRRSSTLSVTSSSTGWPKTGSGNSAAAASGWYSSPKCAPKSSLTTASTSARER